MKDTNKLLIIDRTLSGQLTMPEAATQLNLSERQIYRLKAKVKKLGPQAVIHGNRGKPSKRKLKAELENRITHLAKTEYLGFNDSHFTEKLQEEQQISVSRETVRKLLRSKGLPPKRQHRSPKHRSRRERKTHQGMMIQMDGSHHDWLSGRGPKLCLHLGVDDATNYAWAHFEEAETTNGYFQLTKKIIKDKGLFLSAYADRHSIFKVVRQSPTIQQQLCGIEPQTQVARALQELGIALIPAYSPQAKGRVERLNGVLQDRLVAELNRAKTANIDDANRMLQKFLKDYNQKFTLEAPSLWRNPPEHFDPDFYLCHKEKRTIGADNCFSFQSKIYQLPSTPLRASWTKAKIEVHLLTSGSIRAVYQGQILKTFKPKDAIKNLPTLRKEQKQSSNYKL